MQVLRSAFFDEFVSDLRRVGLNYNTTGNKLIPDEQIEGAWDGAIVFRADTEVRVVLERQADQIAYRVLRLLGELRFRRRDRGILRPHDAGHGEAHRQRYSQS